VPRAVFIYSNLCNTRCEIMSLTHTSCDTFMTIPIHVTYLLHTQQDKYYKLVQCFLLIHDFFNTSLRDACSWKGQLERTRSWKVLSWKVWSWKVALKLERTERSWKEPSEVRKNRLKLERTERSWKGPTEVGKFFFKLESFAEVGKFRCSWKVLAEVGKLSLKLESVTALNNGTKGWTWTVWKCQTGRSKSIKVGGSRKSKPKCTITLISP